MLDLAFGSMRGKKRKPFTSEIKDQIAEKLVRDLRKQKELFEHAGLYVTKEKKKTLKELFGTLKGKWKKSAQELKDELRKEWSSK